MPVPKQSETKGMFIKRCVPIVIHEGRAKGPRQAVAICYKRWAAGYSSRLGYTENVDGSTPSSQRRPRTASPLRNDPSRTAMLRKRFVADMVRRFKRLRRKLIRLIDVEDAFGIRGGSSLLSLNTRWKSRSTPQQIELLKAWLQAEINTEILRSNTQDVWLEKYIQEAYQKGQGRSFDDAMRKYKYGENEQFMGGKKQEFLRQAFQRPASIERVKIMATRAWSDLEGVGKAMETQMQRTLTDSFISGDHPRVMARKLARDVDKIGITRAKTIARTETIRAHADGQLDALESLGVEEVGVMVEWSTAGDDRVCPLCIDLDGVTLKIKEARGNLPRHPNCRCAWIPANVGEKQKGQIRGNRKVNKAFDKSMIKELPKSSTIKTAAEARRRSKWAGADTTIDKTRPDHIAKAATAADKAKNTAGVVLKISNAGPTFAAAVAAEAGASPAVAKMAMAAATIGDFTVPGIPVGSAIVTSLATIKSPGAPVRVIKGLVKKVLKRKAKQGVLRPTLVPTPRTGMIGRGVKTKSKLYRPKIKSTRPGITGKGTTVKPVELKKELDVYKHYDHLKTPKADWDDSKVLVEDVANDRRSHWSHNKIAKEVLGETGKADDLARLGGAPAGVEVGIDNAYLNSDGFSFDMYWTDPKIGQAYREVEMTILPSGQRKLVVENLELTLQKEVRGQGMGTKIFHNQVREVGRWDGVIHTTAASGGDYNGYYTWARLGYDGDIPKKVLAKLEGTPFSGAKKVSDLMRTPESREWWKRHGETFYGKFDTAATSRGREVLERYVAEKY